MRCSLAFIRPPKDSRLEKHGFPKNINDLNKHSFISFGRGAPSPVYNPDWALKLGTKDNKKR